MINPICTYLQVNKLTMDCDDLKCTVLNLGLFWFIEIIDLIDWIIFSEIYYLIVYMYQFTSFKTMDYKWPDYIWLVMHVTQ